MTSVLARELAVDALAASTVPGAEKWAETGEDRQLCRPWRPLLCGAAERIELRLAGRVRA